MVFPPDSHTTHRCYRGLLVPVLAVWAFASLPLWGVTEPGPLSRDRVAVLRKLVRQYLQAQDNVDASDYRAAKTIGDEFVKLPGACPLVPSARRAYNSMDCRSAAKKRTKVLVEGRYPPLDRTQLEKEAAEKFPIYEKGDLVSVWYSLNPVRPSKVTGVYRNRTTGSIQVGRHVILIRDMKALTRNKEELLKFDPDTSNTLRSEYVDGKLAAYEETRTLYEEKVGKLSMEAEEDWAVAENEKMGFVFYGKKWQSVRDIIGGMVTEERERVKRERQIAAEQDMKRKHARILSSMRSQAFVLASMSDLKYASPRKAAEKRDALRKQLEEEEEKAKAEADAQATETSTAAAGEAETKQSGTETDTGEISTHISGDDKVGIFGLSEEDSDALVKYGIFGIIGLVVLVAGGIGVNILLKYLSDPSRFFKGKGSLQKRFWASAESDPDNFKYVAYRYASITEARDALLNLSYITENSSGQLRCRREILFGFYPHQEKFVTFVGGTELTYAMWREATAVLPELPDAEYFRVSTDPEVSLELPNVDELRAESGLDVTHVENREGEGNDYGHYYIYRAADKATALEFLQRSHIQDSSVHVIVETSEGTWGKDENGIYEEGDDREPANDEDDADVTDSDADADADADAGDDGAPVEETTI